MVYQKNLAESVATLFQRWTSDDYAYELYLTDDDQLQWRRDDTSWTSEPEAGRWRRVKAWLIDWLPIESQM